MCQRPYQMMWVDLDGRSMWSISSFAILYGAKHVTHSYIPTAKFCDTAHENYVKCQSFILNRLCEIRTPKNSNKNTQMHMQKQKAKSKWEKEMKWKSLCARVISLSHSLCDQPSSAMHECKLPRSGGTHALASREKVASPIKERRHVGSENPARPMGGRHVSR